MQTRWANPQKIGVIVTRDGVLTYLDSGLDYDAEVLAGPAEYIAPDPDSEINQMTTAEIVKRRQSMQMTFAQLLIGLVAMGWITETEGRAWLGGVLPVPVTALIASLPAGQQFAATARAMRPSVVQRNDGLVLALAALQGRSEADMDAFFVTYAAV